MANRLLKSAITVTQPAVPYQPAVPAYCVWQTYVVPGHYVPTGFVTVTYRDSGGALASQTVYTGFKYVPGGTEQRQVCYPASPEVQAVPAQVSFLPINAWNAGGSSRDLLPGDGYFRFEVGPSPFGAVVGIAQSDVSLLPSDASHAFYIHGDTVDIMEDGDHKLTAPVLHVATNEYRITRDNGVVTYSVGAWSHTSATPSYGPVVLDASLYTSGDFVDNPEMVLGAPTGTVAGRLGPLIGYLSELGVYAEVHGSIGGLDGTLNASPPAGTVVGQFGPLAGTLSYRSHYADVRGAIGGVDGTLQGGFPELQIGSLIGVVGGLAGVSLGVTGEVGQISGQLGPLGGLASDRVYGEIRGQLGSLEGTGDSGWPVPGEIFWTSAAFVGDFYLADNVATDSIGETLTLAEGWDTGLLAEDGIFDALLFQDTLTTELALEAFLNMSLLVSTALPGVAPAEPAQYAVNVLTRALTQYQGFGFDAFACVDQHLYACRPDGVYRVRPGDDDGKSIDAMIDFGASTFDTPVVKGVDAVYLGATTDGQVFVRLRNETSDRLYRVQQRGPIMRSNTARGASGRIWNISLEVADATDFELDLVELLVTPTSRRWIGR